MFSSDACNLDIERLMLTPFEAVVLHSLLQLMFPI